MCVCACIIYYYYYTLTGAFCNRLEVVFRERIAKFHHVTLLPRREFAENACFKYVYNDEYKIAIKYRAQSIRIRSIATTAPSSCAQYSGFLFYFVQFSKAGDILTGTSDDFRKLREVSFVFFLRIVLQLNSGRQTPKLRERTF